MVIFLPIFFESGLLGYLVINGPGRGPLGPKQRFESAWGHYYIRVFVIPFNHILQHCTLSAE